MVRVQSRLPNKIRSAGRSRRAHRKVGPFLLSAIFARGRSKCSGNPKQGRVVRVPLREERRAAGKCIAGLRRYRPGNLKQQQVNHPQNLLVCSNNFSCWTPPAPGSKVAATDARPSGSTIKNRADCTPLLAVNPLFTSCCHWRRSAR